jgi:hypothetical protein
MSDGNALAEAFLLLPGVPVSLLVGALAGAIAAPRIAQRLDAESVGDKGRGKRRRLILLLVMGIPTSFIALVWIAREAIEPPSDASMLRQFDGHEAVFDRLVGMASADKGLQRVGGNWTMPIDTRSAGMSSERLEDYRRLLRDAGTPGGLQTSQGRDGFDFLLWTRGSAISDDTAKGFAYRTNPPPNIVRSLDGIRADSRDALTAYRHIRGNWYLFYQFIPD